MFADLPSTAMALAPHPADLPLKRSDVLTARHGVRRQTKTFISDGYHNKSLTPQYLYSPTSHRYLLWREVPSLLFPPLTLPGRAKMRPLPSLVLFSAFFGQWAAGAFVPTRKDIALHFDNSGRYQIPVIMVRALSSLCVTLC